MNKKLVNYKYGDNLSKYINMNNQLLNYNLNGGNHEITNTTNQKNGTDILLKSFQKLTDEMLSYISNSNNSSDPTDYKKIVQYLLFNIEVLSQYFPNDSLNELSEQINSINAIIDQKLIDIKNLNS